MSLLENNKDVQRGAALLDQSNKTTYLTDLYNSDYGVVKAAIFFVFLGFIIAPLQYAYQNATGTKTYDQLCAKFAKLSIQVEESKGGPGYNALKVQQMQVSTELKGRVQNLTASLTGKTAKADANAIIQAAQYKLQQAYCAAKGMPTDGTNDQADIIEAAIGFSDDLVAGLSTKQVRTSAGEVGETVGGISERIEKTVKELADRGICGGRTDDVQERIEERIGDQLRQKYSGRTGERQFAARTADLRSSQVKASAEKEVSKCISELKKLVKARQDAIEAVGKNQKAMEKQKEKFEEIVAEIGKESKSDPTGLYADRAQLETEIQAADDNEDQVDDNEDQVAELQTELDTVNASISKLEKQVIAELEKAKGLKCTGRTLAKTLEKAEAKYFEHLKKFFDVGKEDGEITASRGREPTVAQALVNAGRVENEEEQDNGSVKVTFAKLPKDADLKKAVNRNALREKVVADHKKDVDLVTRLREEAIDRAKPKAKEEDLSLDEKIARGIQQGFSTIGLGRSFIPQQFNNVDSFVGEEDDNIRSTFVSSLNQRQKRRDMLPLSAILVDDQHQEDEQQVQAMRQQLESQQATGLGQ